MNVLVTRPREAAAPLLAALSARGHVALHEPLLTIEPVPGTDIRLDGVQAILLTSAAGVRALAALTAVRDVPILAVGDATARAARALGFTAVTAAGGNAAALLALARATLDPGGGRVLHASGAEIARDITAGLRTAGFQAERIVLYRARAATALSAACLDALDAGKLGAAMFHSPRMARTFVSLAQAAGRGDRCRKMTALALSEAVATPLHALEWERILSAAASDDAALLDLLAPADGDSE